MYFPSFHHLSADLVRQNVEALHAALPAPVPDTPQTRAVMQEYAFGMFALLNPQDVRAASLAVSVILFSVHASHALSFAADPRSDPSISRQFRRQARGMAKLSRELLRDLQEYQFASAEAAARQPLVPATQAAIPTAAPRTCTTRKAATDLRLFETPSTVH